MKSNPLRRFWALLLSLVLALSLSTPALAAGGPVSIVDESLKFVSGDGFSSPDLYITYGSTSGGTLRAEFERTGTFEDLTFTWAVETPGIVTMDHRTDTITKEYNYNNVSNTFYPVGVGVTKLTLTCVSETGTTTIECSISVQPDSVDVVGLLLSSDGQIFSRNISVSVGTGKTTQITPQISPDNADDQYVLWDVSPAGIISISSSAAATKSGDPITIDALAEGTATITAKSHRNNTITATCVVTVFGEATLTLNKTELSMTLGGTDRSLIGTLANFDGQNIVWTSSDPAVVSVQSRPSFTTSGAAVELTANAVGTAVITAMPQGLTEPSAQCTVTVTAEPVREVHISCPNSGYMAIGGAAWRLSATVIPASAPQTVTWSSTDTSVVTVDSNGRVTAVGPGRTTVVATATGGVTDEYTVEVSGILFPSTQTILVDKTEDMRAKLQLYGNAQTVRIITWTSSNPTVASINSGGAVTGRYPGSSNITVKVGTDYTAICTVTVEEDMAQVVTANVDAGDMLKFSSFRSTLNDRCVSKTGAGLSYITNVSVPTDQGVVYYNYISPDSPNHGVGASENYYYTKPANLREASMIEDMCFIAKGSFNGEATISYTGYNVNSEPYSGKIVVTVKGTGDVTYLTAVDTPLAFRGDDFANTCLNKTGRSIRYVTFGQPSATNGVLYYQYSPAGQYSQKVVSGTKYYFSSNPSIDTLTFVPAAGFSGKVTIPYTCTDSSGSSYSGNVTVNIYAPDGTSSTSGVTYNIAPNQRVTMVASDFNTVCRNKNNSTLNYILFDSLPASNQGVLYYDYSNVNSERVTTDIRYYRSASSSQYRLDRVSFVPASGFTGTVTIPFTGYDNAGGRFTDNLTINVSENSGAVTYSTGVNRPVSFNAPDFNEACQRAMNQGLDHVRFTLPSSREGTLYYNYNASRSSNTRVSSSTNYYRSNGSNAISNITFVPANNFSGTCTFSYTGYASGEGSYSGTVQITVGSGTSTTIPAGITYMGSSLPISLRTQDFQNACSANTGGTLSYIQFNSLPTSAGRLYSSYNSASQSGSAAMVGANYFVNSYPYISQLTFVPKAEYQGQATMTYTGYDTQGRSFTGTVAVSLSNSYCTTPFTDMTNNWAKASVEYLRQAGVVNGYSNNTVYGPNDNVTRGQFTLMICRAFGFPTSGSGASFRDVSSDSVFAGAIATAQSMGIVQGTGNNRFQPNSPITRQSAMTMICRSMEAAGRNVPSVPASTLSSYGDGNRVSDHARNAVASLVYLGVVRGNTSNNLNPGAAISRAEMAVILHRVLTL